MKHTLLTLLLLVLAGCDPWSERQIGGVQGDLVGAARTGDVERIRQALAHGAQLEVGSGVNGWTPLKHAIHKHQTKAVEALLAAGADANSHVGRYGTPLAMATSLQYDDVIQVLRAHGGRPL